MTRRAAQIETPDGSCPASLSVPEGAGQWPAVIMFADAAGMRDTVRQMGERLAGLGYVVLVPDFYYRNGPYEPVGPRMAFGSQEALERTMAWMRGYTSDKVATDVTAFADCLESLPEKRPGAIGVVGYCLGGWISLHAAATLGERVAAAASFHGPNLAKVSYRDSPHHKAGDIRARVLVVGATDDDVFPDEQKEQLKRTLTEAGVTHTVETYPAHHGFAIPDNAKYDEAAAERHWKAIEELFASALG
ncbi:dienelactone hydrolase family protein [Jatrophihabitans sp. DSM 45814]